MKFKRGTNGVDPSEFERLEPNIQALVLYIDHISQRWFGKEIVVTSMLRGDGIHATGRAVDLRSWIYNEGELGRMKEHIEFYFPYGSEKPTFLVHDAGRGSHIHVQVPAY